MLDVEFWILNVQIRQKDKTIKQLNSFSILMNIILIIPKCF